MTEACTRAVTVELDRTLRSETHLEVRQELVMVRRKEVKENGPARKEQGAELSSAVPQPRKMRAEIQVCRIWSQGSSLRTVEAEADLSGLKGRVGGEGSGPST